MKITELLARITADTTSFNSGIDAADRKLKGFGASSETSASKFAQFGASLNNALNVAGIAAGAAGMFQLGKQAVETRARIEGLEKGLTAVIGSASGAATEMSRLREVAKQPGLGFEEAVQGSVRLQAAGLSAETARRAVAGFGNALATVGGGKAELQGVIVALSQISAKGKISAEEINQIAERVPQIRQLMKGAFGTADTEALQKMGIDSKTFIDRIVLELERLPKAAGGMKNDLENISDEWNQVMGDMGKAIGPLAIAITSGLVKAAQGLRDGFSLMYIELEDATDRFKKWTKENKDFVATISRILLTPLVTAANGSGFNKPTPDAPPAPTPPPTTKPSGTPPPGPKPPPSKDELDKWRKRQEDSIKDAYALWDKFSKDMEFLAKRPGLDVDLGSMPSRWHQELADKIRQTDDLKKMDAEAAASAAEWSKRTIEALESVRSKSVETVPIQVTLQQSLANAFMETGDASKLAILQQINDYDELTAAAKSLGVVTYAMAQHDMEALNKKLAVLEEGFKNGKISLAEYTEAYDKLREAMRKVQGDSAPPVTTTRIPTKTQKDPFDARLMREVSTVLTDMSRSLTDLIFQGGKFKDVMSNMAKEVGKSLVRFILQEGLMKIGKELAKIMKDIPGLGGLLKKIPGLGGSGGGSSIPSIGGSGGSIGGSGGGGAASGASGMLGSITAIASAVGSVGTMISSIVFGMKAAKDADVANKHSLQLVMQGEALFDGLTLRLNEIQDRLIEFRSVGIRVFTTDNMLAVAGMGSLSGGGATVTQNIYGNQILGARGMEMLADELVRLIKARW